MTSGFYPRNVMNLLERKLEEAGATAEQVKKLALFPNLGDFLLVVERRAEIVRLKAVPEPRENIDFDATVVGGEKPDFDETVVGEQSKKSHLKVVEFKGSCRD